MFKNMFYQKKKNIQNKYYTLFLRCNQVLVLVETPISLMVLFLHINIYNISSLYYKENTRFKNLNRVFSSFRSS